MSTVTTPSRTDTTTALPACPWWCTADPGAGHDWELDADSRWTRLHRRQVGGFTMFAWMPVIFTFMLGTFPAGLVIYWTWNNTLTVLQQSLIMKKAGMKIELWDNLIKLFVRSPAKTPSV